MTEEVCLWTAVEQAAAIRDRRISARELVRAHLDRIDRINPAVNAIVTVVADKAMDAAKAADEKTTRGEPTGPLHGLPVAHKDLHLTAGIRTTFGSPSMAGHIPDVDDLVVTRLRHAGAITIGKTNTPEFGAGSHTFNPVFGITRNPYDLARTAGGSSGGAAAALACGLHPVADGSDMGGSLRNPAAFCNVVGLRPSLGRVPSWPSTLPWSSLSVQGPMARTVTDVALTLSVLAGPDDRDPVSLSEAGAVFARPPDPDVRGLRLAWSPDLGGLVDVEDEVLDVLEPRIRVFERLGCTLTRDCPDFTGADEVFRVLRAWRFHHAHGRLAAECPELVKETLRDNAAYGGTLSGSDLARAEERRTGLFHRMREFFTRYDALLLPVTQVLPFPVEWEYPCEVAGVGQPDYLSWMRSCYFVSTVGNPALSVPSGFSVGGLPVGLQIVGPHRGDLTTLRVGRAFEVETEFWRHAPPLT
ncbi:amidase [Prauserella marina]|uniref:Amidase n=1 Tax=Prauserella marina TaxID=530584 RepID=A0A222VQK2_9PSEU|nr:amidase [Prauserella marina]ASR36188.1 amidase [Prauserella marina]PWV76939.1 amidase [Prauserella marina]SDD00775.1 amidase [Prauserella marina]